MKRYQLMTVAEAREILTDPDRSRQVEMYADRVTAWRVYDHWMTPAERRATDIERGERLAEKRAREAARRELATV